MPHRIIVVDAYDSFVHILVGYLQILGCTVDIYRRDDENLFKVISESAGDMLLLGPGPGHPADSGYSKLLELNVGHMPVLGVCLGHQAIALHYGCKIDYAKHLMHGKTSRITHDRKGCFQNLPNHFSVMRYHSIVVSDENLSSVISVSARSDDDSYIMGIRHKLLKTEGIQFHPESIGTSQGIEILKNFIKTYVEH
jgi:anthranilate synthase component 2